MYPLPKKKGMDDLRQAMAHTTATAIWDILIVMYLLYFIGNIRAKYLKQMVRFQFTRWLIENPNV